MTTDTAVEVSRVVGTDSTTVRADQDATGAW